MDGLLRFYPADSDKPLFMCEMVCSPGVGESVELPNGELGVVTIVNGEITSDNNIFIDVVLRLL